ncbi:MAG: glycosyltransferase family 2 protein, partial [Microbacteriaceae bacterium]|nr:glycosyltransferase family 2 protein [Microbacteriaceae bacterium]
ADAFRFAALAREMICRNYEWLITMDCDEQHEPARIPDFLAAAARDTADIISGTRYPRGFTTGESAPWDRREINRRITELVNAKLGLQLTDTFCGFKAYRISALKSFDITEQGYAMPMQFWVQAVHAALRIEELPVDLIYNDPTRHFGGMLDDPAVRLNHYIDVFEAARGRAAACARRKCGAKHAAW